MPDSRSLVLANIRERMKAALARLAILENELQQLRFELWQINSVANPPEKPADQE